jgi:hypothetical protein
MELSYLSVIARPKTLSPTLAALLAKTEKGRGAGMALCSFASASPGGVVLLLVTAVQAVAFGSCHLALDLGLLPLRFRSIAIKPRLQTVGQAPHPVEPFVRLSECLLASPQGLTTIAPRLEESPLALIREPLAVIREPLALIREPLALIGEPFALIGDAVAVVGTNLSLNKIPMHPLDALSVPRVRFTITLSHAFTLHTHALPSPAVASRHHPTCGAAGRAGCRMLHGPWSPPRRRARCLGVKPIMRRITECVVLFVDAQRATAPLAFRAPPHQRSREVLRHAERNRHVGS